MASTETNQCPTCGGSGKVPVQPWANGRPLGPYEPMDCPNCQVFHGTGKAPESPEARPSILELPEEQQVELYTRAAEASNEMQREVLERVPEPEATEPRHLQGWKPGWICGKHYAAHDRDCGYTGFRPPAPQPQQNAGELESQRPDIKLVRALQADFKVLYKPGYTTAWKSERLVRNIELGVMRLDNLQAHIAREKLAAVELFETRIRNMLNEANKLPTPYRPDTDFARGFREALIQLLNHEDEPNPKEEMK